MTIPAIAREQTTGKNMTTQFKVCPRQYMYHIHQLQRLLGWHKIFSELLNFFDRGYIWLSHRFTCLGTL